MLTEEKLGEVVFFPLNLEAFRRKVRAVVKEQNLRYNAQRIDDAAKQQYQQYLKSQKDYKA